VRDLLNRTGDGAFARRLTRRHHVGHRKGDRAEHCGVPGAEVLRGELAAGDLAQVGVDVVTLDVDPAVGSLVAEQLGPTAAGPLQRDNQLAEVLVGD